MARILAVDDERAILDALARVLGRDGHEVVRAADPTAVPGMDLSRFDLVLCDVMMPGLDGFELVRHVSVNIFFTIFTNVFSPIAPTRMRRIRLRGCAAFGV